MRLADILADEEAQAVASTRWRVVGEREGHQPHETVHGSLPLAMAHADLRHRVSDCRRVAILEERYTARGPAYPWPVWLFEGGALLDRERTQAEIVKGNAADWCVPGDATQMDML